MAAKTPRENSENATIWRNGGFTLCKIGYQRPNPEKLVQQIFNEKWVRVALVWTAGSVSGLVFSLILHFLVFGGADTDTFRRGLVVAVVPTLAVCTSFLLLGLVSAELSAVKQQYARELGRDSLTSCLNGPLFSAMIDAFPTLMGSRSGRQFGSFLVIDVDHLKRLNESVGHRTGDQALRLIAGIIRASVRSGDLVGRIGGDEFGVFLPGATKDEAEKVAERIRHSSAEAHFEAGGSIWPLSVSVGVVLFESEIDFDDLLRAAGQQMQAAKKAGRNRIESTQLKSGPSPSRPALH